MEIAIVILNWNGRKHLERFLPSVVKNSQGEQVRIVVADNGSTDDSMSFLVENYPQINIIRLDRNYGFAEGYNKALQQIDSDYYVLLNSDVEVSENWIWPVLEVMGSDLSIAAAMPKVKSLIEPTDFEYAGAAGGFIDHYGYPFCRGRLINTIESDHGQYDSTSEVAWATGACLFIRAEAYHEVGGLDGDFFAHMEEIDMAWRLLLHDYRILCVPSSTVYHLGGGTLSKHSPHKLYLNFRNSLFVLYKNLPKKRLWKTLIVRLLLDQLAAFVYLLQGKYSFFKAVQQAHWTFLMSRRSLVIKRKANSLHLTSRYPNVISCRSMLWQYYFRKRKTFKHLNL